MEVAPFFVDFHHFLSIFTIFYRFSRFTHFCRDLHFVAIYTLFPQFFFGQNSHLRNKSPFFMYAPKMAKMTPFKPFWGYQKWYFGCPNQNSETTFQYKLAPKTTKKTKTDFWRFCIVLIFLCHFPISTGQIKNGRNQSNMKSKV